MGINNSTKIGVVILNYLNYKSTIECVDSFLNQTNVSLEIVVVDNGSKNNSYDILTKHYMNYKNIKVIGNKINEGYAKGNNIGIAYLRKSNVNFVIVANSDTKILKNNTISKLINMYVPNIAIISPNIKNVDGSNALYVVYKKKFLKLRLIKACLQAIFYKRSKIADNSMKNTKNNIMFEANGNDVIGLTGSFYILTPSFFKYYDGLFDKTFLYFEENATIECLRKRGLNSLKVNDDDKNLILHKGAASSSEIIQISNRKKKLMAKSALKVLGFIIFG